MHRALDALRRFVPACVDRATEQILASGMGLYREMQPDVLRRGMRRVLDAILADLDRGHIDAYPTALADIARQRVEQGAAALELLHAMSVAHDIISAHFRETFADDLDARLWWEQQRNALAHDGVMAFVRAYMTAREAFIREQGLEILRLSAPILPLYEGILLMPLIGAIDAPRAAQITAAVLQSIDHHKASIVILDVTGVAFSDRAVIGYLRQAAAAMRLMGAEVILVGVRPEIARVAVDLGLTGKTTTIRADLQGGIEHALRALGKAIRPLG